MAAGFTTLLDECLNHSSVNSQDTTGQVTPAVGDFVCVMVAEDEGGGLAVSGGGMTWTQRGSTIQVPDTTDAAGVFEATAGTPSLDNITISITSGGFVDMAVAVIRPTDLVYDQIAGTNSSDNSTDMTVSLSTTSPAALLCYGASSNPALTFTQDSGWTELIDNTHGSGSSHQVQYRLSDDTEVHVDPSSTSPLIGICIEFSAAGGGSAVVVFAQQHG